MAIKIKIEGMTCHHCKMNVEKVISKISGINSYTVNLEKGEATITGNPDINLIIEAINKIGYRATLIE